jgi:predicted RNase H-like nuclease (RuvC/YqgF family)
MLSVVVILIALSLIGGLWYGYSYLNESRATLAGVPELRKLAGMTGTRLTALEGTLTNWSADRTALSDQMSRLESSVSSNAKSVRNQAQAFATEMGGRIREELNQKLRAFDSRIGGVESVQRETQDHVSQLQNEITNLRQQLASVQQKNEEQLSELQNAAKSETSRVNNQFSTQTNRLNALNDQVDRKRVTFDLPNNQTKEIAPGVYVTVKRTDVGHQQVDGWMQLATEGRIVWIRGLSAQNALTFVTRADSRPQALVFTRIGAKETTGYLLVPGPADGSAVATEPSR